MPSLNQLAAKIANLKGEPFNHELKERIKDSYRSKTAERLRQSFEKSGIDDEVKLSFEANLIRVEDSDACKIITECGLFVTENPIPEMVRFKGDAPFTFVGDRDGTVYTYVKYWERKFRKYYPIVASSPFYMLHNRYLVTNSKKDSIIVESIFINLEAVMAICTDSKCYDDDMEYPIPMDMIESITTELLQVYGYDTTTDKTIKTVENEKNR